MKILREVLKDSNLMFYRFKVFVKDSEGTNRCVGMAYLQEGQTIYTLRLWTFLNEKFFLLPSKDDPKKYLVMTREPNNTSSGGNKYFWNIVGSAKANASQTTLEINFDVFEKKFYVNIIPETSTLQHHPLNVKSKDLIA